MPMMTFRPSDSRCPYYAQLIRREDALPAMREFRGEGRYLPGADVARKTVEVRPVDWVLTGEARHHRKMRGYTVQAHTVNADGAHWQWTPDAATKEALKVWVGRGPDRKGDARLRKAGRMPRLDVRREDLLGGGDPAAMLRLVHADRAGLTIDRLARTKHAIARAARMFEARRRREREAEAAAMKVRLEELAAARVAEAAYRRDLADGAFDGVDFAA